MSLHFQTIRGVERLLSSALKILHDVLQNRRCCLGCRATCVLLGGRAMCVLLGGRATCVLLGGRATCVLLGGREAGLRVCCWEAGLRVCCWEAHRSKPSRRPRLAEFLGALAKWRKGTQLSHVSVCPHGATRFPLDGFSRNFTSEYFSKIFREIQVSSKSEKNNRYFT